MRSTVQGTSEAAVTHEWFDGNVWHSDELTRWQVGIWIHALDPSARPVVVTATTSGLLALRWNGSAYVVENTGVSLTQNTSLGSMQVAVSPEGVIHLVVQDTAGGVIHAWRTSSWNQEVVTVPSLTEGLIQAAATTAIAKGKMVIVTFESMDARGQKDKVIALLKAADVARRDDPRSPTQRNDDEIFRFTGRVAMPSDSGRPCRSRCSCGPSGSRYWAT